MEGRPEERPRPRPEGRHWGWGVAKTVIVAVAVFVILMLPQTQALIAQVKSGLKKGEIAPALAYREYPETVDYVFTRSLVSSSPKGGDMQYSLALGKPVSEEGQNVVSFTTAPTPGAEGGGFINWTGTVPDGSQATITLSYNVKMTTKRWTMSPTESGSPSDVPASYRKYLGDEWKIVPSNPAVATLSQTLTSDKPTVYEKLKSIYNYMVADYQYQANKPGEPQDVITTMNVKAGDCDDQSILFASLARAAGIPAWMKLGLLYDQSKGKWGGHGWLVVYVPMRSGSGVVADLDIVNKEFLMRDPFHLTDYTDDGGGDRIGDYYVTWRYWASGSVAIKGEPDDRFDITTYNPSKGVVRVAAEDVGAKDIVGSGKSGAPGFEGVMVVAAAVAAVAVMRRRRDG